MELQILRFDTTNVWSFNSTPKFKGYQRPAVKATPAKGIDIDAVGNINGTPIYDFDITKLDTEEKPWRKPGRF